VSNAKHYLPCDTSELLFSNSGMPIQNASLKVEKYIRAYNDPNKKLKVAEVYEFNEAEKKLLKALNDSRNAAFTKSETGATIIGTLGSRMVVGLGSANVFETGMIFHKPYGFPYIPGSSIKGALRHFIIREAFTSKEELANTNCDFSKAFGSESSRGALFFYDAYPKNINQLELDILNPHFADYYMNSQPPTDTYEPKFIKFHAVPAKTKFIFHITGETNVKINDLSILDWFKEMLKYSGLGAKTTVGYGWMQNVEGISNGKR